MPGFVLSISSAVSTPAPEGYALDKPCLIVQEKHINKTTGYGACNIPRFGKKITGSHIVAWIDANGRLPSPETPCVLHHCDVRACVEPTHLCEGTKKDNAQDTVRRGRYRSGMSAKTHCKHGHPFDEENTRILPEGYRECKECQRLKNLRRAARVAAVTGRPLDVRPNAWKTHCPQGHPYSGENLYIQPSNGGRICRACLRASQRVRYERWRDKKAAAKLAQH